MKRFTKLMIALAIVAMAVPGFAAVENIKVGGDITIYGVHRNNFPLQDNEEGWGDIIDNQSFFQTHTRVWVKAQLTDNVEAMVRLGNERFWATHECQDIDDGITGRGGDSNSRIHLDLAYIKVSDLGITGLDLTVGKQEIQLGEGLVVGSAYLPNNWYPGSWGEGGVPPSQDLGVRKPFDAIRVDYGTDGPVDVTAFMAKISEPRWVDQDINLYGLNVGFAIPDVAKLEGYYVRLQEMDDIDVNVTTIGVRATGDVGGLKLKGEFAKQLGEIVTGVDNEGWALLLGGKYEFPTAMSAYVHANLNLYTGQDGSENTAWTTFFPANTAERIGPINYALVTSFAGPWLLNNARVINVGAGVRPVEKICLSFDWWNVNFMEEMLGESSVGNEIAAGVTYNYTEDLSFGLQYGILLLGDAMEMVLDDDPWQLIASAKVAF